MAAMMASLNSNQVLCSRRSPCRVRNAASRGDESISSLSVASVIFCLPESPRWLVRVNKVKQATRNLAALKNLPEDDEAIRTEIAQIESSLEFATARNNSLMEMFSKNDDERLFYRFCLCFALQFFQQMSGGNLISVYSTIIFQRGLGLDAQTSRILSGGTLTWKFLSCFVSFFTIDRFGRRVALMVSGTGYVILDPFQTLNVSPPHFYSEIY